MRVRFWMRDVWRDLWTRRQVSNQTGILYHQARGGKYVLESITYAQQLLHLGFLLLSVAFWRKPLLAAAEHYGFYD